MKLPMCVTGAQKGMLFTLITIVLVTLMLAIVMTYLLLNINYDNQASRAYGVLGTDNFASLIQSAMPSLLATSLQNAQHAYLSENLVEWLPLSGNANDYSRNGNDGASTNVIYVPTATAQVAGFDGVGSYINLGNTAKLDFASNSFTVLAWVYPKTPINTYGSYGQVLARTTSGGEGYEFGWFGNSDCTVLYATNGPTTIYSSNTICKDGWASIGLTSSGGTSTFYINGAQAGSGLINYPSEASTNTGIGRAPDRASPSLDFNGLITDIQIYNTSLSTNQMASVYVEGMHGAPVTPVDSAILFPINASASEALSSLLSGTPSISGTSLSDYVAALQKQSLVRNVHLTITNQSVDVFQTSPLWLNITYSALASVNSTFGAVLYPLHSSVALPVAVAYSNISLSNTGSASFDGSSSYIDIGNVPEISSSSTSWTISFWMNSGSVANYKNALDANFVPSGNNAGPRFEQSGPSIFSLAIGTDQGDSNGYTYTDSLIPNTWYYVVAIRSGDAVVGYLNGVEVFNSPNTLWPSGFTNLTIGKGGEDLPNRWFIGNITNIQTYCAVLSASQIASMYAAGTGGSPQQYGLAGWWPLDGNANDYSGNGNNGAAYDVAYSSSNVPGQFQQMLAFNASQYSAYERVDLGNVRFYHNDVPLYSWCESGCTNASTASVLWVKLPDGIRAFSNTVMTMAFLPKYVGYDSGIGAHAGEAPQLSPIYGQYDNGASVFTFYDNFQSGDSRWTIYQGGGSSYSFNNGLSITSGVSSGMELYARASQNPSIVESLITNGQGTNLGTAIGWSTVAPSSNGDLNTGYWIDNGFSSAYSARIIGIAGGSLTYAPSTAYTFPATCVISFSWPSTGSENFLLNFSPIMAGTDTSIGWSTAHVFIQQSSGDTATSTYQWVRTRVNPPNGIMPTTSFGDVVRLV